MSPAPSWRDSSVGSALHQYGRGHGFKSYQRLNFFKAAILTFYNCGDQLLVCIPIFLWSYDHIIIHLNVPKLLFIKPTYTSLRKSSHPL